VRTDLFDFDLPAARIAQQAVEPRDSARLMVLDRSTASWRHHRFHELPELLSSKDVLVRNDTRVLPARLAGVRAATGGRWEGLYLRTLPSGAWEMLASTRGRPRPGESINVDGGLVLILESQDANGRWTVRSSPDGPAELLLARYGHAPLPPYIRGGQEQATDRDRYQTVYARAPGAVAAPTAGLHFTEALLQRLAERGTGVVDLTLHVGLGTFRPIAATEIEEHVLHAEPAEITARAASAINDRRAAGGRAVAVGTTSARVIETAWRDGSIRAFRGTTDLYIRPGHAFRGVDALVTNFHLPRSSLLVMVAAFAGLEFTQSAYKEAIREGYRFYSYGDAMLIL
jgi:S-adenosylmethionine:tRNA ribosyltransferase-isomerase